MVSLTCKVANKLVLKDTNSPQVFQAIFSAGAVFHFFWHTLAAVSKQRTAKWIVPGAPLAYGVAMLVSVERLTKTYRNFTAVNDVSFVVQAGEIAGLVGPNGAGKTTIIHMLLGLISPNAGTVRLFGRSLDEDREHILRRLNFTTPYMAFPARLTVLENLRVFAEIYNVREPIAKITELLERFGIGHLRKKPVSRLSSGETTRVGLCKAFLNNPELLLLDEPTAYLDPQAALHVRDVLVDLQRTCGTTILYTSHNMLEVQRICNRIIFLDRGSIMAAGTPIEVTRKVLQEDRDAPALDEVFIRIAKRHSNEAVSN
jgi:ABC-2 type transport system ATP-binding protein